MPNLSRAFCNSSLLSPPFGSAPVTSGGLPLLQFNAKKEKEKRVNASLFKTRKEDVDVGRIRLVRDYDYSRVFMPQEQLREETIT